MKIKAFLMAGISLAVLAGLVEDKNKEFLKTRPSFEHSNNTINPYSHVPHNFKEPEWKYEIKFRYEPSNAPMNISVADFLSVTKKASEVLEKTCGVRFKFVGFNNQFFPLSHSQNQREFGVIQWKDLSSSLGQADKGSTSQPAYGFKLYINPSHFNDNHDYNMALLLDVLVHELGHVIGLSHNTFNNSVMNAYHSNVTYSKEAGITMFNHDDIMSCQNIVSEWKHNPINKKNKI